MKRGFSLVELLSVLAISTLLLVIVTSALFNVRNNRTLKEAANRLVSLLEEARSKTLAGEENSSFGVRIQTSRLVLFKGSSFSETSSNKAIPLAGNIVATTSLVGGGTDIVFGRLTGAVIAYGTSTVSLSGNPGKNISITISPGGVVTY